jgi:lipoprotein-releasing system permease protein
VNLPLQIAWRYLRRPTDRLISAVGLVSVLGLVIGVMALVISMALMTGYREDLQEKLLAGNAEIFVYAIDGTIEDTPALAATIGEVEGVQNASPVVFQQALITSEDHATGEQVMLKGIDPERVTESEMLARIGGPGRFLGPDGVPGVTIGKWLAQKLGVAPGSAVTVTVPTEEAGSFLPRSETYGVISIYETGFFEFDSRWIFMPADSAHQLLATEGRSNLIEVKLTTPSRMDKVIASIRALVGTRYAVADWREMNRQLFSLLKVQQLVLFIVIGLIVFVSTFNIVSTLIMTVHEKRKEIGILLSMGGDRSLVRKIFVYYGTLVGMVGTVTGILIGVVTNWIITRYELISFGPEIAEVYFVNSIPFVTRWGDVGLIALFAIVVSFLATLIPSARAARIAPADAVRYE